MIKSYDLRPYIYTICSYSLQIQDYYLAIKLNDGNKLIKAFGKLFMVGCMLRAFKIGGSNRGHQYPKIQYTYLLLLYYWKSIDFCTFKMLKHNTGIFNEELGEITFSILCRCVNGDPTKDDFEHMQKVFRTLPVLRDIKDDVVQDNGIATSLSWRHKIKKDGEEVNTVALFFQQTIRRIVAGHYQSYDNTVRSYKNRNIAILKSNKTDVIYTVFLKRDQLINYIDAIHNTAKLDMTSDFCHSYADIWPEAEYKCERREGDVSESSDTSIIGVGDDYQDINLDNNIEDDVIDADAECEDVMPNNIDSENNQDEEDDVSQNQADDDDEGPLSPYCNRTWNAWGNVHPENTMFGRRERRTPTRLYPSRRRIERG